MESLEVIKIKLNGILGCIDEYTGEPSIENIIAECKKVMNTNNLDILLFLCKEISDWYNKNINEIQRNEFVYNKDVHYKNLETIKEISEDLEKNLEVYKEQINSIVKENNSSIDKDIIIKLLSRFHLIVKQLRHRYDNRETLDVEDEYDVQDLLHSVLYIYCDDIRTEEWCPSYAGKCSRQDFLLKQEKIVIETKKTRKNLDAKKVADELIIDIERYKKHPDCKTLICFVYDPEERIKNPRGLENDLTHETDGLNVIVLIKP